MDLKLRIKYAKAIQEIVLDERDLELDKFYIKDLEKFKQEDRLKIQLAEQHIFYKGTDQKCSQMERGQVFYKLLNKTDQIFERINEIKNSEIDLEKYNPEKPSSQFTTKELVNPESKDMTRETREMGELSKIFEKLIEFQNGNSPLKRMKQYSDFGGTENPVDDEWEKE